MKLTIAFAFLSVCFLFGCKNNTVTVMVPDLGTYQGKVAQYGVDGNLTSNQAGASVQIVGTAFTTTTDASGKFEIDHVPAGIYNLLITRPGFDTDIIINDQFSGAGTQFFENEAIQAIPFDSVQILSAAFQLVSKDTVPNQDSIMRFHILASFRNTGPDSMLPVSIVAHDLRSHFAFEIPHTGPTARAFSADTTFGEWFSQNSLAHGDSISIITRVQSIGPNRGYGALYSPDSMIRTFVIP